MGLWACWQGRAAIDGETFISGSLTVEGTVMGSGPYVDTSDGRCAGRKEHRSRQLIESRR